MKFSKLDVDHHNIRLPLIITQATHTHLFTQFTYLCVRTQRSAY